jgi:hypothetical protein
MRLRVLLAVGALVPGLLASALSLSAQTWDHVYQNTTYTSRLLVKDKNNVLIKNVTIRDVTAIEALRIENCENVRIENVTIYNHRSPGNHHLSAIRLEGVNTRDVVITGCTIYNVDGNGIATGGTSDNLSYHDQPMPNVVIENNLIYNTGQKPVTGVFSPQHGMYVKAIDATVRGNTIYNAYDGECISIRSTGTITRNTFWNWKTAGLAYWNQKPAGPSAWFWAENNVGHQISGNDNSMAYRIGYDANHPRRLHNFKVRFNTGVVLGTGKVGAITGIYHNEYTNEQFIGNLLVNTRAGTATWPYIDVLSNVEYAARNLHANSTGAHFLNAGAADFRLKSTSTAINHAANITPPAGVTNLYPASDKNLVARAAASADAGAYEFVP